jgi:hypothetical protein
MKHARRSVSRPWLTEIKSISVAIPKPERLLRGLAYLLVSLAVVYVVILLSYNVRVIVIGEAPKNLLSPLALVAGGLGLLAMFALEPFRNNKDFPFVAGFLRFFPLAFLFLVPLAGWALPRSKLSCRHRSSRVARASLQ